MSQSFVTIAGREDHSMLEKGCMSDVPFNNVKGLPLIYSDVAVHCTAKPLEEQLGPDIKFPVSKCLWKSCSLPSSENMSISSLKIWAMLPRESGFLAK